MVPVYVMIANMLQVQVDFNVQARHQFDQGGLIVWRDSETWLKTGIEVVDGRPRLSCVVTRNGFSDWSTQPWATSSMRLRLSQTGDGSYVVEVCGCCACLMNGRDGAGALLVELNFWIHSASFREFVPHELNLN